MRSAAAQCLTKEIGVVSEGTRCRRACTSVRPLTAARSSARCRCNVSSSSWRSDPVNGRPGVNAAVMDRSFVVVGIPARSDRTLLCECGSRDALKPPRIAFAGKTPGLAYASKKPGETRCAGFPRRSLAFGMSARRRQTEGRGFIDDTTNGIVPRRGRGPSPSNTAALVGRGQLHAAEQTPRAVSFCVLEFHATSVRAVAMVCLNWRQPSQSERRALWS